MIELWKVFPEPQKEENKKEEKSKEKEIKNKENSKEKKRQADIKLKSFILLIINFILLFGYFYFRFPLFIENINNFDPRDFSVIFEFFLLFIFFILTFIGFFLILFYFIRGFLNKSYKKENNRLYSWYDINRDIDIIIILAVIIRFFIQPFSVFGASMEPNFYDHEYIIVNQISYKLKQPKRGDVIVFKYPKDKTKNYIKRIIGLPGEKIEIKDNNVFIYNKENLVGTKLQESYLKEDTETETKNNNNIELKSNEYFVMGDNRKFSSDSREWGILTSDNILGKVWFVCWPFSNWQVLKNTEYNIYYNLNLIK